MRAPSARSCCSSGGELAVDEEPQPVVLAEQREQAAQVEVGEPVHVGVLLAADLRGRVGDLAGLGDRARDAGAVGTTRPAARTTSWWARTRAGEPVDEVVGVGRGSGRDQHPQVALDLADQRRQPQAVRGPDDRGGDLVEVGRRRGADPRPDHQTGEGAPPHREAGQLAAAEHVVGVGVVGEPGQQLEVRTPHERAAVAVVEPVQGEGGGGPLGDGDEALRGCGRASRSRAGPTPGRRCRAG